MDVDQWIILGLCVILGLGFVAGNLSNARKLRWISRSAESALVKYGRVTTSRRLGNSGLQLIVDKAGPPYRQVELVVLLEARENLLLWAFERIRGRRDEFLLRANLRSAPAEEIVFGEVRAGGVRTRTAGGQHIARERAWRHPGEEALGQAGIHSRLIEFLDRYGQQVRGVSIQPKEPHLMVRAALGASDPASFEILLETIRQLVRLG